MNLLNLCGKINHACNTDNRIFNDGVVALLSKIKDGFGMRLGAATIYGNFVTSPHANTTLFRGCKRCSDVERAIELIFKKDVVQEIVLHMVVAMTVLPHAAAATDPRSASAVAAANLRALRDGRPLKHVVVRARGY